MESYCLSDEDDYKLAPVVDQSYLDNEKVRFKGHLEISTNEDDERRQLVSEDEENLFYKVPRRVLTYLDSCPSLITELMIDFDQEDDRVSLCCTSNALAAKRFTVEIPFEKFVKYMEPEGISREKYVEELYGEVNRHIIITKAIRNYAKKCLQLNEYDANLVEKPTGSMMKRSSSKVSSTLARFGTFSQRHDTISGAIQFTLSNNEGNTVRRPHIHLEMIGKHQINEKQSNLFNVLNKKSTKALNTSYKPADL